jgi:hypothetical protein
MLKFKPALDNWVILLIMLAVGIVITVLLQIFRGKFERIIEKNIIEKNREWEAKRASRK